LIKAIRKGEPISRKKLGKIIKNKVRERSPSDVRESPLTLQRALEALSQDFWEPYYNNKLSKQDIIRQHVHMMSSHLAHVDSFGVDNELFDEAMAKAIVWGQENGTPVKEQDVLRSYDLLRASQRIALRRMNPTLRDVQNKVRATTNVMLLGLSALVSVPELIIIAMNTGALNTLKGAAQDVAVRLGKKQGLLAMQDLGLGMDQAMNTSVNRISGDNVWSIGRIEENFFKAIQLHKLQNVLSTWAARSTDIYLKRTLNDLVNGKIGTTETVLFTEKLKQAGIQLQQFENWRAEGFPIDSGFYKDAYIPAINRLVRDTIVDPKPVDKPLWMSDPRFMLIAQLKGFMTVFTNRIMRNWWQATKADPRGNIQLATHIAPYFALYIAAQIGVQAVKELLIKGDLEDWDEKGTATRVISAAGYAGGLGYFVDTLNHATWRTSTLGSISPAAGLAERTVHDSVRAIQASDPEEALTKVLIKALPTPFGQLAKEAMYGDN
jgi:hypothetical protein